MLLGPAVATKNKQSIAKSIPDFVPGLIPIARATSTDPGLRDHIRAGRERCRQQLPLGLCPLRQHLPSVFGRWKEGHTLHHGSVGTWHQAGRESSKWGWRGHGASGGEGEKELPSLSCPQPLGAGGGCK